MECDDFANSDSCSINAKSYDLQGWGNILLDSLFYMVYNLSPITSQINVPELRFLDTYKFNSMFRQSWADLTFLSQTADKKDSPVPPAK